MATTFAGMAMDAIEERQARPDDRHQHGCYTLVPIPDPKLGPRHVEVDTMYNTERYRPIYDQKLGLPIFLTRA